MESYQSPILLCFRASPSCLQEVLASYPSYGRTALARQLCEAFGFYAATGALRTSNCLAALRVLNGEGKIKPPPSRSRRDRSNARLLATPIPSPLGGLDLSTKMR